MGVSASRHVAASPERVWEIATDLENLVSNITAISGVEVHDVGGDDFVGAKWTETRKVMGKEATETMWITEAEKHSYYVARAESHGSIYTSKWKMTPEGDGTNVELSFDSEPTTLLAKLMSPLNLLFSGTIRKAFESDLDDVKRLAEA